MKIKSKINIGSQLDPADQSLIKKETMLFRATKGFAQVNGGELTQRFLSKLPWDNVLIDSRTHMLMPGMYPCIPGWHHDDVPRDRSDGQPNYENPIYKSQHCMAIWGDCSLTEFAIGEYDFSIPPVGMKIYKNISPIVDGLCDNGILNKIIAPEHHLIYFDWNTWHRGAATTKTGFRFFIRATKNSNLKPQNEIRYNANVYMPVLEEGW